MKKQHTWKRHLQGLHSDYPLDHWSPGQSGHGVYTRIPDSDPGWWLCAVLRHSDTPQLLTTSSFAPKTPKQVWLLVSSIQEPGPLPVAASRGQFQHLTPSAQALPVLFRLLPDGATPSPQCCG